MKNLLKTGLPVRPIVTIIFGLALPFLECSEVSANSSIGLLSNPADAKVLTQNSPMAREIKGTITDENGNPLTGVTVKVKGTNTGTVTDAQGNFTLQAPENGVLEVSYIGYESKEIPLTSTSIIRVVLVSSVSSLNQLVVVGYGTQKKADLTGSVASVSGAELTKRPITNPAAMLEGLIPGVRVNQGSGEPGNESVSIQIRGTGTFSSAGSNPLILIDGVPGSLSDLNPNDIASVSVLKDAASASIYGSMAANGVILVTTKTGQGGKLSVQYSGNYASSTPTRMFHLITNSAEYMELFNEARINSGLNSDLYTQDQIDTYRNATDRNLYPNTDWLGLIFRTAPTQTHNLTFSGGSKATTYNVSLGYVNQDGVMKGFHYDKYTARFNISSQINDHIRFGAIVGMKKGKSSGPRQGSQDLFLAAMSQAPTYAPQLADGSGRYTFKAYDFEYNNKNPIAIVNNKVFNDVDNYAFNPQAWVEVEFVKGLRWYAKGAINTNFSKSNDFRPQIPLYNFRTNQYATLLDVGGEGLTVRDETNIYSNLYTYLSYDHDFHGGHSLKAQFGYSLEENTWQYLSGYRKEFPSDQLRELDAGSPSVQTANGTRQDWAIRSYFGRINYNYKERYLLEANLRYDGTSRLSPDSRWGAFPSVSAGWRLSEEKFIRQLALPWLNSIKIRASYGKLGNQNIGLYPYQALLSLTGNYPFNDANLTTGVAQTQLSNPHIKWETTTMTDVGLDLTVFKGLSVTFDWYRKLTKDILRSSQVTGVVGLDPPTINDGSLENKGVELAINYQHVVNHGSLEGLHYYAGVNLSHNRNEVVRFGQPEIGGDAGWGVNGFTIREEGVEWDSYYTLQTIGIFQTTEEITKSPKQFNDATVPGDIKYKDENGDGKIDADDRVVMGGRYPKLNYSASLGGNWKGFDVSVLFQGVDGVKHLVSNWGMMPFVQGSPPTTAWLNRWTENKPSKTMPRIYWGWSAPDRFRRASSWFLRDASYFRLKNLVIGYAFSTRFLEKLSISKLRVYFSGDNLLTVTKYPGLDPETTGGNWFVQYPQNKVYSFGVNLNF